MFGPLLNFELNKIAFESPAPVTPGVQKVPTRVTPGVLPGAAPITPAKPVQPEPLQAQSSYFNLGQKMASQQESTMNMFGVLVNMELQKLAAEAPTFKDIKKKAPKPTGSNIFGVKAPEEELELPELGTFKKKQ